MLPVAEYFALHQWRLAHRTADLAELLVWGMTRVMDVAISHALDLDPKTLVAAGNEAELIANIRAAYNESGAEEEWREFSDTTIRAYLEQYAHDQVGDTLADYGIVPAPDFSLLSDRVVPAIDVSTNRIKGNAQVVWDKAVKPDLIAGVEDGESIPKLADRVRRSVPETYRNRGVTIARTEVVAATNAAQYDVGRQFDLGDKQWLATFDERTRDSHEIADGQTVPRDEPFVLLGGELMYPGDHSGPPGEVINCRCALLWVPRGEDREDVDDDPEETSIVRDVAAAAASKYVEHRLQQTGRLALPRGGRPAQIGPGPFTAPLNDETILDLVERRDGTWGLPKGFVQGDDVRVNSTRDRMARGERPGPRPDDDDVFGARPDVLELPAVCASACEVAGSGIGPARFIRERVDDVEEWVDRETKARRVTEAGIEDSTGKLDWQPDLVEELTEGGLSKPRAILTERGFKDYQTVDYLEMNPYVRSPEYPGPVTGDLVRLSDPEYQEEMLDRLRDVVKRDDLTLVEPEDITGTPEELAWGLIQRGADTDHLDFAGDYVKKFDADKLFEVLIDDDVDMTAKGWPPTFVRLAFSDMTKREIPELLLDVADFSTAGPRAAGRADDLAQIFASQVDGVTAKGRDPFEVLSEVFGKDLSNIDEVVELIGEGLGEEDEFILDVFHTFLPSKQGGRFLQVLADVVDDDLDVFYRDLVQGIADWEIVDDVDTAGELLLRFGSPSADEWLDIYRSTAVGDRYGMGWRLDDVLDDPDISWNVQLGQLSGPKMSARLLHSLADGTDAYPGRVDFSSSEPVILWRGGDWKAAFGVDSVDDLEGLVGERIADRGFMSTSYDPDISVRFMNKDEQTSKMLIELEAPEGLRGFTGNPNESEIVFAPNTEIGVREIRVLTDDAGEEVVWVRATILDDDTADSFAPALSLDDDVIDSAALAPDNDLSPGWMDELRDAGGDEALIWPAPNLERVLSDRSERFVDVITEYERADLGDVLHDLSKNLKAELKPSRPTIATQEETIRSLLLEELDPDSLGGRYKSQFETDRSSSALFDTDRRQDLERGMLGYEYGSPESLRPIYGFDDDGYTGIAGNGFYGDVKIRVRKSDDDMTVSFGDSANHEPVIPVLVSEIDSSSIERLLASFYSDDEYEMFLEHYFETGKPVSKFIEERSTGYDPNVGGIADDVDIGPFATGYKEIQFHGGVTLEDIESIDFPSIPSRETIELLEHEDLLISWTVDGEVLTAAQVKDALAPKLDFKTLPRLNEPSGLADRMAKELEGLEEAIEEYGEEAVAAKIEELRDDLQVVSPGMIRTTSTLTDVLETALLQGSNGQDARFKTQFETKRSGVMYDPARRTEIEESLMGYPTDTEDHLRPLYGVDFGDPAISYGEFGLGLYGDAGVVFRQDVTKMSVSRGDSHDWQRLPIATTERATASPERLLSAGQSSFELGDMLRLDVGPTQYAAENAVGKYREVQFHGPLRVSDIEAIYTDDHALIELVERLNEEQETEIDILGALEDLLPNDYADQRPPWR